MSTRGYTTRPASMPVGQIIQNNIQDNNENTYRAADGQILQSSMVKTGSPSKKRAGSVSQVRFSLPPPESENSFEDDDEISIVQGFDNDGDDSDDFEKRTIFNQGSRELEAPIRGRKSSRNDISISDSMRQLVSTSPERNKLFIRGDSELNNQPLPIPVELKIPPLLSPNNKGKKRPSSLIYNGLDYEPFENELASDPRYIKAKSLEFVNSPKSLPTPTTSPTHLKQQISRSIQSPETSKQIEIPDLSKPYHNPIKNKKTELDNEKEIQNPSRAAKQQNNQLNQRFSFPAGPQNAISTDKDNNVLDKDLPTLPPQPAHKEPSSKGLEIYTNTGPLHTSSSSFNNSPVGRFAQPEKEPAYDYHYTHQNSAYKPAVSRPLHSHRRSQSQIIDFCVDDLDELPRSSEKTFASNQVTKPAPVTELSATESDEASNRELTPESQYSSYDEEAQEEDISYDNSIQESCDLENDQDDDVQSIDVESIQSAESVLSADDVDPDQLLDLGRLIISSRSNVDLSKSAPKPKATRSSSPLAEQTTFKQQANMNNASQLTIRKNRPQQQHRVLPPPPQTQISTISKPVQPLGSQHQPHVVRLSDNFEPEHIRQISQSRILVNRTKSNKVGYSPNPSHSSYESEISEPFSETFSAASTAQTAETAESVHRSGSIMVDLTNDNYDITIKKDDRNATVDQYKSTFQEINGKYRETIVLDDEDNLSDNDGSIVQPLRVRHRRSKSALGNLEFEGSNRAVSSFSFETVASEVQLHYNSGDKEKGINMNDRRSLRTYTDQNKSVIELCDDTMRTTQTVLDELKRQKTILMNKHAEMLQKKKKDEDQLASIRELQANLMKTKGLRPTATQRPKSYVYGEDPSKFLQHRRNQSSSNYFDYVNNQSYNFETFMRSQSSGTLI